MRIYAGISKNIAPDKKHCDDRILVGNVLLDDGYYEVEKPNEAGVVIGVADGVGGRPAGWRAASISLQGIGILNDYNMIDGQTVLRTVAAVNDELRRQSDLQEETKGMASTLSFLKLAGRRVTFFHLGDTRIYNLSVIQGHTVFRQATQDQNKLAEWGCEDDPDVEEIKMNNPDWMVITGYMGMTTEALCERAVVGELPLTGSFLLTSDGVHDYVPERELKSLLAAEEDQHQRIKALMSLARENGSMDDQSVILLKTE